MNRSLRQSDDVERISPVYATQSSQMTQELTPTQDSSSIVEEEEVKDDAWGQLVKLGIPNEIEQSHTFLLRGDEVVIGRNKSSQVVLDDPRISGKHCVLVREVIPQKSSVSFLGGSKLMLSLCDVSRNGISVNSIPVGKNQKKLLNSGDIISFLCPSGASKNDNFIYVYSERKFGSGDPTGVQSKYDFVHKLGNGNFSEVYRAVHRENGESFAIKIIDKKKQFKKNTSQEQLDREVEILKNLRHPNIVSIIDTLDENDYFFLVLELAEGGELFDRIDQVGHFEERDAREVFMQILNAIEYLHSQNIVHRDLKPENILLDGKEGLRIKISDFGLARFSTNRALKTLCGTPHYVAPEVICQASDQGVGYGKEVDLWSAGVILYVLLSGTMPFSEDETCESYLYECIRNGMYDFPEENGWYHVSAEAKDLICRLLTTNPRERYSAKRAKEHLWFKKHIEEDSHELLTPKLIRNTSMKNRGSRRFSSAAILKANREGKNSWKEGKKEASFDSSGTDPLASSVFDSDDGAASKEERRNLAEPREKEEHKGLDEGWSSPQTPNRDDEKVEIDMDDGMANGTASETLQEEDDDSFVVDSAVIESEVESDLDVGGSIPWVESRKSHDDTGNGQTKIKESVEREEEAKERKERKKREGKGKGRREDERENRESVEKGKRGSEKEKPSMKRKTGFVRGPPRVKRAKVDEGSPSLSPSLSPYPGGSPSLVSSPSLSPLPLSCASRSSPSLSPSAVEPSHAKSLQRFMSNSPLVHEIPPKVPPSQKSKGARCLNFDSSDEEEKGRKESQVAEKASGEESSGSSSIDLLSDELIVTPDSKGKGGRSLTVNEGRGKGGVGERGGRGKGGGGRDGRTRKGGKKGSEDGDGDEELSEEKNKKERERGKKEKENTGLSRRSSTRQKMMKQTKRDKHQDQIKL